MLAYATGVHNQLNKDQQVDDHPYVIQFGPKLTYVTTDLAKKEYSETCTFRRDFKTMWSDIPIIPGTVYEYIAGFKVYKSTGFAASTADGFNDGLTFDFYDGARSLTASLIGAISLLVVSF